MPDLIFQNININDSDFVQKLVSTFSELAIKEENFYKLNIQNSIYFSVSPVQISDSAGWYIILDNNAYPIYVGTTENLNKRLNTSNNSRDNFGNSRRTNDDTRNFIKKYRELGIISELYVIVIPENELRQRLQIDLTLSKRDRENFEKILNIFRSSILYPAYLRINTIN